METWFWILGWFLFILTITENGFIIFLVCNHRQLRTKTNAFIVSFAVTDFFVGMSVVSSLFFCDMTSTCNWPHVWLSWANVMGWLFSYLSVTKLVLFSIGSPHCRCKAFQVLNFYDLLSRHANNSFSWVTMFFYNASIVTLVNFLHAFCH